MQVNFACRCGVLFRATRWRWIDRDTLLEEADRARHEGPVRGICPNCGAPATARVDWLELEPSQERAVLILGPQQRHQLVELLRDHLAALAERIARGELELTEEWLLRPAWRFDDGDTSSAFRPAPVSEAPSVHPSQRAPANETMVVAVHELEVLNEHEHEHGHESESDHEDTARRQAPQKNDGVPKLVGGAAAWPTVVPAAAGAAYTYLARLAVDHVSTGEGEDEEIVTVDLDLDDAGRSLWGQAALQVRPIHLRDHGYPLIGVRLVASYLGRMSLIDAIVDVGSDDAAEVFAALSRRFRVQLVLRGEGSSSVRREVSGRDLERNAALCLESARASLAKREYPRDAFRRALDSLRETELDERLRAAPQTLVAGAYRHLIAPRETWLALEHLEASSDKKNLAQLLECDGLSVDEYEAIRKRVLVASVEHGLCAPRRFWRRIIASGLSDDFDDYAARLAAARAEADQDGDDLDAEQRSAAWARIAELCDLKQLEYPAELRRKLGIGEPDRPRRRVRAESSGPKARANARRSDPNRSRSASGEIQARPAGRDGTGNLRDQLRDRSLRLRVASAALANGGTPEAIESVFEVIDEFTEEELLAILPSIAELGTQAVPSLHSKLDSPNQQLRQAAAILLGLARDPSSIVPLMRRLIREDTRVWFDIARAIGALGSAALERLCVLVRQSARAESLPIDRTELHMRIGRAMAEVVIAEGGPDSIARDSLEALAQSSEPELALAANRALATLHEVSVAGAQVRGERSLSDHTQLRGFARRAYEAITVPELDLLDEEVEAELT